MLYIVHEIVCKLDNLDRNIVTIYQEYYSLSMIIIHSDNRVLDFHIYKPHKTTRSVRFENGILINNEINALLVGFNCDFTKSYNAVGSSAPTDTTMSIGISNGTLTSNSVDYSAFGINTQRQYRIYVIHWP